MNIKEIKKLFYDMADYIEEYGDSTVSNNKTGKTHNAVSIDDDIYLEYDPEDNTLVFVFAESNTLKEKYRLKDDDPLIYAIQQLNNSMNDL